MSKSYPTVETLGAMNKKLICATRGHGISRVMATYKTWQGDVVNQCPTTDIPTDPDWLVGAEVFEPCTNIEYLCRELARVGLDLKRDKKDLIVYRP